MGKIVRYTVLASVVIGLLSGCNLQGTNDKGNIEELEVSQESQKGSIKETDTELEVSKHEVVLEIPYNNSVDLTRTFTISVMGDCTLGTDLNYGYDGSFMAMAEVQDSSYFFQKVKPFLEQDDLTLINLEGPLTDSVNTKEKRFAFRGELSYVDILTEGSVEAVNYANNHSYDQGIEGLDDTKQVLQDAGVTGSGYEDTPVVEVNGVAVGLVGIYALVECTEAQVAERIQQVKEAGAEVIIVSFHWGIEREARPNAKQESLAKAAIDAGADLVVGTHPHVLQGIEKYKDRYILYSLGNFCFGGNRNPADKDTIIYQQTFTVDSRGELKTDDNIEIIPCSISSIGGRNNFQPMPLEGSEKERVASKLQERSMIDIQPFIIP